MPYVMRSDLLTLSLFLFLLLTGCNRGEGTFYRETGECFTTYYTVTYRAEEPLAEQIDSTMDAFNAVLNNFDPTSVVSRINANTSDRTDPMLEEVLRQAMIVSEATDGVYDVTGGPLFDIWGFGTKKGVTRLATDEQVDSVLQFVGYRQIHMDTVAHRITKDDPRLSMGLASLSKGYVVDLVARTLEHYGVEDYMVEIGGEVTCDGRNPRSECWSLGINKPIEDNTSTVNELLGKIEMCEKLGVATSGDYRNYKVIEGKKVAHTVNAVTGRPAHSDILEATVVAPTTMEADAWATAFMAVGLERAKEILEGQPQLGVLFVYADPTGTGYLTYTHRLNLLPLK